MNQKAKGPWEKNRKEVRRKERKWTFKTLLNGKLRVHSEKLLRGPT